MVHGPKSLAVLFNSFASAFFALQASFNCCRIGSVWDIFYATCSMQCTSVHRMCKSTYYTSFDREKCGILRVYDLPGLLLQFVGYGSAKAQH